MAYFFVLYGDDSQYLFKELQNIEQKIQNKYPDIVIKSFENPTNKEISAFLDNGNLFGSLFCIKIKKTKELPDISLYKETNNIFIIYTDETKDPLLYITTNIKKTPCILPKPWDLLKIIQQRFKNKISVEAVEYLSQNILSILDIEDLQNQMTFYKMDYLNIETLLFLLPEEEISHFTLVEYFFLQEKSNLFLQAISSLASRGYSFELFLNSLLKRVKDMLFIKSSIKEKKNIETLAKELKLHSFIVNKMLDASQPYSHTMLKQLYIQINQTYFLSRFYSSQMDLLLITLLFFKKQEFVIENF